MTTNLKQVASVAALAATLPDLIGKLRTELEDINGQMAALKRAGLIYASEHMKDGKYLVLVYPSKNGEARRRDYVGKKPQKIQEAREAIQRAREYDTLEREAQRVQSIVSQGHDALLNATRVLTGHKY